MATVLAEVEHPSHESQAANYGFEDIIGHSDALKKSIAIARKVSRTDVSGILIQGETGTGKELLARAIHYTGPRSDQPFIEINCAAIPETLLERELFGHERGAFTDARERSRGLLEIADGGSLFLDEIGHMSLSLQAKVVKAIEEKRFRRLGGSEEVEVNVRIIAATSRNLEEAMAERSFRSDLYYRLNVIKIEPPPLRERGGDVIELAEHFLEKLSEEYDREVYGFNPESMKLLMSYPWPGNVRELKNAIERAVLLGDRPRICPEDLPDTIRAYSAPPPESYTLTIEIPGSGTSFDMIERNIIEKMLHVTGGNKSMTARLLGISRPRILRKLSSREVVRKV